MKFEKIRIFELPFKRFKQGAAVTIPGIGIFVGKGNAQDMNLLRHEFGHVLQYRKWGFWKFWKHIVPASLKSARAAQKQHVNHMSTWTEWSANRLAYQYFNQPIDWNFHAFPIVPTIDNYASKRRFRETDKEFFVDWQSGGMV